MTIIIKSNEKRLKIACFRIGNPPKDLIYCAFLSGLRSENPRRQPFVTGKNLFCEICECAVGKFEMSFIIVADGSQLQIEFHCGRIPSENLKIDALKTRFGSDLSDLSEQLFTDAFRSAGRGNINIFEINSGLAAETGKIWVKDRIAGDRPFDLDHKTANEGVWFK